jgi:phosphoribosyl 1,2-cyclic phosphate phosphodiesterase
MSRPQITVLGTSALGVPSFFCDCKACEEARRDPGVSRGCCGLAIRVEQADSSEIVTLIDTSPDLRLQLVRERISDIERVLFTHEHFDHIGGLPQLEYYIKLKAKKNLPIYAGEQTLATLRQQFSFFLDTLELHRCEAWQRLEFDGICYSFIPATHSKGAFGFVIEAKDGHGPALAYFPDTATLQEDTAKRLRGIDILMIDSSFNGNNWMPHSHHSIDQAIALADELDAGQCILTHLSMHYDTPITTAELNTKLEVYQGRVLAAFDGQRIIL